MAGEGQKPIQLALLGAGLFTKDAYIPLCRRHAGAVQIRALWSRSATATSSLLPVIQEFSAEVKGYHGDDQLEHLLRDSSIDAVAIVLPVQVMLQVAIRCLKAGKHVLQEKPVAQSVEAVKAAIIEHQQHHDQPVWALAENYRSEQGFRKAGQLIHQLGSIIKLDLIADMPMNSSNKYFGSQWRRDSQGCPGGFVTDSSVHHIAALRALGTAAGLGEVVTASATALSVSEELPPPDTLVGTVKFASGTPAGVSITFAGSVLRFSLSVTGTKGSLEVLRGGWQGSKAGYTLSYQTTSSNGPQIEQIPFSGLDDELTAFIHQVEERRHGATAGRADAVHADAVYRTAVEEGARDLAVIEALRQSSQDGSRRVNVIEIPSRPAS